MLDKKNCSEQSEGENNTPVGRKKERIYFLYMPIAIVLLVIVNLSKIIPELLGNWIPIHDTRNHFSEFFYAFSAFEQGELPLWNSYLHGGEPFYLFMNHSQLLNPIPWLWIILGTFFKQPYMDMYVYTNLTNMVFFALGGFFFLRELLRNNFPAIAAFLILLFSGEMVYWSIQIWSFITIVYVPWILFFALKYYRMQTLRNALLFACFSGIAINVYYTIVYLIAFLVPFFLFTILFRFSSLKVINYKRLAIHAIPSAFIIGVLFLPTLMVFSEVNTNYHQVGRFKAPGKEITYEDRKEYGLVTSRGNFDKIYPGMFFVHNGYIESVPLIGVFAFLFLFLGMGRMSKSSLVWTGVLALIVLNYLGWVNIYNYLSFYLIPGYKLIRSFGFFSGYIILIATVLACMGIQGTLKKFSAGDRDSTRPGFWMSEIFLLAMLGYILFLLPPDDKVIPFVLGIVAALFLATNYRHKEEAVRKYKHLILATFLLVGVYNLNLIANLPCQREQNTVFDYSGTFNFSLIRPDDYLNKGHDGLYPYGFTFFQTANKTDGPYTFEGWGSKNTLLVNKMYHTMSSLKGFGLLMKPKLHFLRNYAAAQGNPETIADFTPFLDKSVLLLDNDALVAAKNSKVKMGDMDAIKAGNKIVPQIFMVTKKTANTVQFTIEAPEHLFMLYTDLYDKGFSVLVDGVKAPLLKGMGFLKAVELNKGRHVVEFVYKPLYGYVLFSYLVFSLAFFACLAGWGGREAYRYFTS